MNKAIATLILASLLMSTLPLNVSADETQDIPTNAQATGVHDTLVDAVIQAGLLETLQGDGPFTVFAPTDAAFEAAGVDLSTFTTDEDNQTLANILTYHVVAGSVTAADVTDGMTAATVNGANLSFSVADGVVTVNNAKVTTADVMASNGVIHVIDAVLTPPAAEPAGPTLNIPETAQSTGVHTSLVAALSHAELVETLQGDGPFTVFAPTDEAFAAAGIDLSAFDTAEENETLSDILLYHVLSGAVPSSDVTDGLTVAMVNGDNASFTVTADGVTIEGANVTTADVETTNGVIHVIDKVLMPPADPVVVPDIPSIAASTGVHDALVAALTKADLVATLQGEGPFTVFAPTDQAFTDAGIDLDAFTTEEEIAVLADILLYHVLSGAVPSSDVTDGLTVAMVNGDNASFTVTADGVTIEGASVTTADVTASNGVIHVIDKVLMPPADEPTLPDCDAVVGIAPSGLKYSPATLSISVGDTVCWQWTDSSMAHNVRQVDGEDSTTYTQNGVTSGEAAMTVDFRYTFTEDDTTFYYACEPHLAAGMYGKVIVGDGGATAVVEPTEPVDTSDEDENTPGFVSTTLIVALLGAVVVIQRRQSA
ncbi:MAG TPA: fasciclin domain-containing protein [Candidatus Poseidoniales archaeon]|jgi:transforming growth factor-beta-induced protein|nr:MAG TPA: fasciclin domain-containing protein [Candidatus Poseidoniales archaeon]HII21829.1 fasciclin domain-containing protein [Candidatus Poseidoniaceae archaeon]|tara:strand:- start:832 stop:2622 length:1791 start_codon:yes stop_codon:yes gene_type:complete